MNTEQGQNEATSRPAVAWSDVLGSWKTPEGKVIAVSYETKYSCLCEFGPSDIDWIGKKWLLDNCEKLY